MGDLADVRAREPEFYRWYQDLPVVTAAAEVPPGPAHAKGPAAAPVTIVEYSDFACSHCARARRDLDRLIAERSSDVRLVFRHFPLDTSCNPTLRHSVHPTACEAAMAAECAAELGKFWEFHDYLFDNQQPHDYPRAAAALGLDLERFQSCLASGRGREAVARDVAAAASLGVESTPTLFINGRTVRGALDSRLYEAALVIEKSRADHGG
jgi:protein-disulfide isomerase